MRQHKDETTANHD